MTNKLSIASCNISGLNDATKRKSVFTWLRSQNYDIVMLQETHCHLKRDEYRWSREWDGQSLWSRGTNRSRGVAVLFNRRCRYDVRNVKIDGNGRYIYFDLHIEDSTYKMVNIYAPNDNYERVKFIANINNWLDPNIDTLIGGDFNCALNSVIDRSNCVNSEDIGKIDVQHLIQQHNLVDVWRRRFPYKRAYSWQRGNKASRIDYWLVSTCLDSQIEHVGYRQCAMSDHKLVELTMRTSDTPHGCGIWKMNIQVIQSKLFKDCFTNFWKKIANEKR